MRRSRPRPLRFVLVGAVLGFIVLGIVSMARPDRSAEFDVAYDPSVSLGLMSLFGAFLGALLGALVAALLAARADRSAERAARASDPVAGPTTERDETSAT